jgi:N6-L-threonylcarbamoyladenine synthase
LLILVEDFFKHRIIGSTIDDAAGEAFDKVAKMLGLGYPGGQLIDKCSKSGNSQFHKFPSATVKENPFDFSFSGIKTSVLYFLRKLDFGNTKDDKLVSDICASFQEAVVKSLFDKTLEAAKKNNVKIISVSGGVSANSELRKKFDSLKNKGYRIFFPGPEYSTDNAAMIGLTGYLKYTLSENKDFYNSDSFNQNAKAKLNYDNF